AAALEQIDQRLAEGGGEAVAAEAERCRRDLALLRELDAIDHLRWTPTGPGTNGWPAVVARWRGALAGYGGVPGTTPSGEAAALAGQSLVRGRLLAALDLWLAAAPAPEVRAVLKAADPDPYREAIRDAVVASDAGRLVDLAGRPEALAQPPGFV